MRKLSKMNILQCFILLCVFKTSSEVYGHRVRRLIGAENAVDGQIPYIVSLRYTGGKQHFCAGSIIHSKYILTAAHCLSRHSPKDFYIVAGTNLLTTETERYYVEKFSIHSDFNKTKFIRNDIGLIKLKKGLKLSKFIQQIPLHNSEVPVGASVSVSGWGSRFFTYFGGYFLFTRSSKNLHFINVKTVSLKECRKDYRENRTDDYKSINKRNICTFNGIGNGFCYGDSGGPLVYNGRLVGIVSWSTYCAMYPDVYVKVSAYNQWIHNTMKKLNRP